MDKNNFKKFVKECIDEVVNEGDNFKLKPLETPKVRKSWGDLNPTTRIHGQGKQGIKPKYDRNRDKNWKRDLDEDKEKKDKPVNEMSGTSAAQGFYGKHWCDPDPERKKMKNIAAKSVGGNLAEGVGGSMNLSSIVEQITNGSFYDWTQDFDLFKKTLNSATESAKLKFEKSLRRRVVGKSVLIRASKGYKQPVKDYTIKKVTSVNINDFYDDWVVVLKNEFNKEYFLTAGYKIKILGAAVAKEPGAAEVPEQEPVQPQQPQEPQAKPTEPQVVPPQKPNNPLK